MTLDVTSEPAWADATARAEAHFGGVDVLVNNAAYLQVGTTESIDLREWNQVLETCSSVTSRVSARARWELLALPRVDAIAAR